MKHWKLGLGLMTLLVAAGCQAPPHPAPTVAGAQAADTQVSILRFTADWTVSQSGAIAKGGQLQIVYDPARLPQCRAKSATGEDTWSIVASYSLDGVVPGDNQIAITQIQGNGRGEPPSTVVLSPQVDVPLGTFGGGHDLALWFRNTDATGCEAWDSNYGRNFHFQIEDGSEAGSTAGQLHE